MEDDGYFISDEMMENISKFVAIADSPVLLISHGPPLGWDEKSIDYANNRKNVGSAKLLEVMKENGIKFGLFGHIHEAYGATDMSGNVVQESTFVDELLFNPGAVKDGRGGVVEIDNRKISYGIIEEN